jgi:peptide/nickel transport system substrate-binding protein
MSTLIKCFLERIPVCEAGFRGCPSTSDRLRNPTIASSAYVESALVSKTRLTDANLKLRIGANIKHEGIVMSSNSLHLSRAGLLALALGAAFAFPAAARDLTIALSSNVNTLDPFKSTTVGTDLSVAAHIYTPLVDRGPDLKLRPGLATKWEAVGDTVWRFTLREGVTFSNGEKLDAEAVKWNVERVLDPKTAARNKPWFAAITEVRVISPTVVEFVTKNAYPDLPDQMSMFLLMPPKWTEQNNPSVAALGSGPYELVRFASGDRIELKARKDYWGEKPAFDNLTFRIIPEDASRIAALLTGDVDLITTFPTSELKRIKESGKADAGSITGTRGMFVKLNALKAPFKDNPKLWRALNLAIDRKAINDGLLDGLAEVSACQPLSPVYFGFNPDLKPVPYDPAQAKKLLAEAGFPNGLDIELEVPTGRYLLASDIAQVIASQLGEVGVRVKLTELEFGAFMNKYLVGRKLADSAYFGLGWPTLDAGGLLNFWEKENPQAYWESDSFTDGAKAARATNDPAKRTELYRKLTQQLCEGAPSIFMFFTPITYAQAKDISWQARGDDWVRAMDVKTR